MEKNTARDTSIAKTSLCTYPVNLHLNWTWLTARFNSLMVLLATDGSSCAHSLLWAMSIASLSATFVFRLFSSWDSTFWCILLSSWQSNDLILHWILSVRERLRQMQKQKDIVLRRSGMKNPWQHWCISSAGTIVWPTIQSPIESQSLVERLTFISFRSDNVADIQ